MKKSLITLLFAVISIMTAAAQTPAFPGAEGFGRFVTGGRGGSVYHVTNLNDSGTGSLRWAIGQNGLKTIVFDISGTIHLKSQLGITNNTTIAGQTAPGDGICVADYPMNIKGSNVIVRYMRFRLGNTNVTIDGADGWDGFGALDQQNIIVDHCSISWSIDECMSFCGNKNITAQWCLIAQSLVNAGHSKGAHGYGGNWGGSGASYLHNLLMHHSSRTPRLGPRPTTQLDERMDMRNNVIYNWGGLGCYGGEAMKVNIVNNYYKLGPATLARSTEIQKRIASPGIRTTEYVTNSPAYKPAWHIWGKYFVDGNVNSKYTDVTNDNWTYGVYNQISGSNNDGLYNQTVRDTIKLTQPIPFIHSTTFTAEEAYNKVIAYAGCCINRDRYDQTMISDAQNATASYTGTGLSSGFINTQEDTKPSDADSTWSAWPTLNTDSTKMLADSDGDGMPDSYENANDLNPKDASDGNIKNSEGYTNLEVYLNSIVANITKAEYEGGTVEGYESLDSLINNDNKSDSTKTGTIDYVFDSSTGAAGGSVSGTSNPFLFLSNGKTFSIANSSSKTYATGGTVEGHDASTIKYSASNWTVTLPQNVTISTVTFEGYGNDASTDGSISNINGVDVSANNYIFKAGKSTANSNKYTYTLPTPATGTLTFTVASKQICAYVTLTEITADKISSAKITNVRLLNDVYTIDGKMLHHNMSAEQISKLPHGVYIINDKKISIK
jgi:hypothetical protein